MRNNKGITLVALVITIIVLLILAGVSISMVVGENGVLNRAQNAATDTAKAQAMEALEMDISGYQGSEAVTTKIINGTYKDDESFFDDVVEHYKTETSINDGYTATLVEKTSVGTTEYAEATVKKGDDEIGKFYVIKSGKVGTTVSKTEPKAGS